LDLQLSVLAGHSFAGFSMCSNYLAESPKFKAVWQNILNYFNSASRPVHLGFDACVLPRESLFAVF
jgi:hypothetical protein